MPSTAGLPQPSSGPFDHREQQAPQGADGGERADDVQRAPLVVAGLRQRPTAFPAKTTAATGTATRNTDPHQKKFNRIAADGWARWRLSAPGERRPDGHRLGALGARGRSPWRSTAWRA